ncbi:MAG: hypothetical protein OEV73_13340 [Desulfobulbaceae bacterium]|nr:hypothetical protein [Desulfobulbaceae bacterium]
MAEISAGPSESGIFESITMPATMGLSGHDSALVGNGAISDTLGWMPRCGGG